MYVSIDIRSISWRIEHIRMYTTTTLDVRMDVHIMRHAIAYICYTHKLMYENVYMYMYDVC